MRRMFDAAWPPASPPAWEAAAGYIGGNTPHVWTDAEWARQLARWRLPIYVRSHDGDPVADAHEAIAWLAAHGVPKGSTLALDYETRVDPVYLQTFDRLVSAAGCPVMVYGSRGTVLRNPKPSGGYWDADWPGPGETAYPHLSSGSAATQWSGSGPFGGAYDPSLVADTTPLWDTQGGDMSAADVQAIKDHIDKRVGTDARSVDQLIGIIVHGDDDPRRNSLDSIAALVKAIQPSGPVDPGELAAALAPLVVPLLAGALEIIGITTDPGGLVTVTFGPKATP